MKNIVLVGMPGSGKSTIGQLLAQRKSMNFIDIDEMIEKKEGKKISEIFKDGEEAFRKIETEVIKVTSNCQNTVISTGGGIVKNKINIDILKENGIIVFIDRELEEIKKDINMATRPLLSSLDVLQDLYNERYDLYVNCANVIIKNAGTKEDVAEKILKELKTQIV